MREAAEGGFASADEIELKAMVPDVAACRARVERAGATLVFAGALRDRRWDTTRREFAARDEVLRLRSAEPRAQGPGRAHASIDWKGPTRFEDGYKVREERSTAIGDAALLTLILVRAGFVVTREVDREVEQYDLAGAMIRFETYPRMDVLVEVEGTPATIEPAIAATGLPRTAFGTGRLADFAAAYERRTGERAAVCLRELGGEFLFREDDA